MSNPFFHSVSLASRTSQTQVPGMQARAMSAQTGGNSREGGAGEFSVPPSPAPSTPAASPSPTAIAPAPVTQPGPAAPTATSRPTTVQQAIARASERTSVDYEYLIAQAELESGLNPRAKARTSSATGLFQFLDNSWLGTMKRHGARFGFGNVADQIRTASNGRPYVPDQGQRNAILALRNDPEIASLLAAGLAEDNRAHLAPILGREPDHGELYLAHFLGAGGAKKFLTAMQNNPSQSAASVFPRAAAANRPIFYEPGGKPRSLFGMMDLIDSKMRRALARVGEPGMTARLNANIAPQLPSNAPFDPSANTAVSLASSTPFPRPSFDRSGGAPIDTGFASLATAGGVRSYAQPSAGQASSFRSPPSQISMSSMLRATFGGDGAPPLASAEGAAQVKRAYAQLKAFGL